MLALDEFLFPKRLVPSISDPHNCGYPLFFKMLTYCIFLVNSMPLISQTPEEIQLDEQLDCQVMELIRDEILPQAALYPPHFIAKIMTLLNKGSIHSAAPAGK